MRRHKPSRYHERRSRGVEAIGVGQLVGLGNPLSDSALNVTALFQSCPAYLAVLDGSLSFGDVPAASSTWSFDMFSVRWDASFPVVPPDITWSINYYDVAGGAHELIEVQGPPFPPIPAVPEPAA